MKIPRSLVLLVLITPFSFGAEVLESLRTREGREYFKVEVLTNDEVGIRIRHDAGTARIPYEDLPDAIQSKYHAERKKAAVLKIEATNAEIERIKLEEQKNKRALLEQKTKKPVKPRPVSNVPKPDGKNEIQPANGGQEVQKLEGYIADMNARARDAAAEAIRLRGLAEKERSKNRTVSRGYSDTGGYSTRVVPDKSGWAQAAKYEEEAAALDLQVQKARALIIEAKSKLSDLTETPVPRTSGE